MFSWKYECFSRNYGATLKLKTRRLRNKFVHFSNKARTFLIDEKSLISSASQPCLLNPNRAHLESNDHQPLLRRNEQFPPPGERDRQSGLFENNYVNQISKWGSDVKGINKKSTRQTSMDDFKLKGRDDK